MIRFVKIACFFFVLITPVHAQIVAILDQGLNSQLNHQGKNKIVGQGCSSFADSLTSAPSLTWSNGRRWRFSLCQNGLKEAFFVKDTAVHPRRPIPLIDNFPLPPGATPHAHFTSDKLDHGRALNDSLHLFHSGVYKFIFQVYGFDTLKARRNLPPFAAGGYPGVIDQLLLENKDGFNPGYNTDRGLTIVKAMQWIDRFPGNIGSISIATVVGNPNLTADECLAPALGESVVRSLRAKGIAVIAGLHNRDTPTNVLSWPNCIPGVINAGNPRNPPNGDGIGIGANGVDFFIDAELTYGDLKVFGNSTASPRLAGVFALLQNAYPSSTIEQRYEALQFASDRTFTYQGFTRRKITRSQISNAITELGKLVNASNPIDPVDPPTDTPPTEGVIAVLSRAFGTLFESDTTTPKINLSIANSSPKAVSNIASDSSAVISSPQDLIVEFDAKIKSSFSGKRNFLVLVNGVRTDTRSINQDVEQKISITVHRDSLKHGANIIEIKPSRQEDEWGIKNVIVKAFPVINLRIGARDSDIHSNRFGTPRRRTSVAYKFSFGGSKTDVKIDYHGRYVSKFNATRITVNGQQVGFMPFNTSNIIDLDTDRRYHEIFVGANLLKSSDNSIRFESIKGVNSSFGVDRLLVSKSSTEIVPVGIELLTEKLKRNVPFSVRASFKNTGRNPAPQSTVSFYISKDNVPSSDDRLLSTKTVGELTRNQSSQTIATLVTDKINKGYYLYAYYRPHPSETNKSNNSTPRIELKGVSGVGVVSAIMLLLSDDPPVDQSSIEEEPTQ